MEEILQKNDPAATPISEVKFTLTPKDGEGAPLVKGFTDPRSIIENIELQAGMSVADFGCGTGYFSLPVAKKVGEEGMVYALDILTEKLEVVESQARLQGITNIITKRVNLENKEGSRLEAESVDWIILKDILFQNKNKDQILEEAKRVLKSKGKILLIEWKKEGTSIGPNSKIRISRDELMELINKNELGILKEIDTGNFHYCLILVK